MNSFGLKFLKCIAYFLILFSVTQAQCKETSITQRRIIETRKFSKVDILKLIEAIDAVNVEIGFFSPGCSNLPKQNLMFWCQAYISSTPLKGKPGTITFLLKYDEKENATYLRIVFNASLGNIKENEFKDELYIEYFRILGNFLFIDAQKIDLQEIN